MASSQAYPLPNAVESAAETERLSVLQESWILVLGGSLSLIPFPANAKIAVDLGCGTGIWIRTMAPQHPNTTFIGVDINPPIEGALENCRFIKANVEDEWTFLGSPGSVDYFLARLLTTGVRDWQSFYHKAFAATAPGGYFESQEAYMGLVSDDDEKYKDQPLMRWMRCLADFAESNGVETASIDKHAERLEAAGYKVVAQKSTIRWLDSSRPEAKGSERISEIEFGQIEGVVDGMSPRVFAHSTTMSPEEGRKLAAEAKEDLRMNSGRCGYRTRTLVVVAQKAQ